MKLLYKILTSDDADQLKALIQQQKKVCETNHVNYLQLGKPQSSGNKHWQSMLYCKKPIPTFIADATKTLEETTFEKLENLVKTFLNEQMDEFWLPHGNIQYEHGIWKQKIIRSR